MRTPNAAAQLAIFAIALVACSTSSSIDASPSDATIRNVDAALLDVTMRRMDGDPPLDGECPGYKPIPSNVIYECDALADDALGCSGTINWSVSWGDGGVYPVGCRALVPMQQGGCSGVCCGAQRCYCIEQPQGVPGGPVFACPM